MSVTVLSEAITPTRNLNYLYIWLDCVFLAVFLGLLLWQKRYQAVIFALFGGILYTAVDYGGFYLLAGARQVFIDGILATDAQTFGILLWMSMSYGITNFAFIWVALARDKEAKYWIFLILMWWLICPSIAEMGGAPTVTTTRTTGQYHGLMGVVLVVSYFVLIVCLLARRKPFVSVLYLCLIGFSVQFGWEFALLINGIRPLNEASFKTLLVNSCLETNLGMPLIYLIFRSVRRWRNEDFSPVMRTVPAASENV